MKELWFSIKLKRTLRRLGRREKKKGRKGGGGEERSVLGEDWAFQQEFLGYIRWVLDNTEGSNSVESKLGGKKFITQGSQSLSYTQWLLYPKVQPQF